MGISIEGYVVPIYKATLEIEVDGDDIDWFHETIECMEVSCDGLKITDIAMYARNPPDYPTDEWWAEQEDE
jgi:hypothetical protein